MSITHSGRRDLRDQVVGTTGSCGLQATVVLLPSRASAHTLSLTGASAS